VRSNRLTKNALVALLVLVLLAAVTPAGAAEAPTPEATEEATANTVTEPTATASGVEARTSSSLGSPADSVLSTGWNHNCAVTEDDQLTCWGHNEHAKALPPAGSFSQVSAGRHHTCGLRTDGELECWGLGTSGQTTAPSGPFREVAAGDDHTCAVRDTGVVACWGSNTEGQSTPPTMALTGLTSGMSYTCGLDASQSVVCWGATGVPPSGAFLRISTGASHSCGLRPDTGVTCWGYDNFGQTIPPGGSFLDVAVGIDHSCAVRIDGTLVCWGRNTLGALAPPPGTFTRVTGGVEHSCAVRTDRLVECWGAGSFGQDTAPTGPSTQLDSGDAHVCSVSSDGTVSCRGRNDYGQATAPPGTFSQVSAGATHSCGVRTDQTLECWGTPSTIGTPPAGTFSSVSAGTFDSCAVRTSGELVCWSDPETETPPDGTFTQVSSGYPHSCARRSDGTLSCWGPAWLGDTTPPTGTFAQVSAGAWQSCGVRTGGSLACWAFEAFDGWLGGNVPTSDDFVGVSTGTPDTHSCGLRSNAGIECWGIDAYGATDAPTGSYEAVSVGQEHTCGLTTDGTVTCWGLMAVTGGAVVVPEGTTLGDLYVWPRVIGDDGPATLRIFGTGVGSTTSVALISPDGQTTVTAQRLLALDGDNGIEARFDLPAIVAGSWGLRLSTAGVVTADLPDTVTVEASTGDDLWVSLSGHSQVRVGVPFTLMVTVGNRGNRDARVVPVYLDDLPPGTEVEARFPEIAMPDELLPGLRSDLIDLTTVAPMVENDDATLMAPMLLSNVPAHSIVDLPVRITIWSEDEAVVQAWVTECVSDAQLPLLPTLGAMAGPSGTVVSPNPGARTTNCLRTTVEATVDIGLSFVPGSGCIKSGYTSYTKMAVAGAAASAAFGVVESATTGSGSWGSRTAVAVGSVVVDCALDFFPATKGWKVARTFWKWGKRAYAAKDVPSSCLRRKPPVRHKVEPLLAVDPNQKVGPTGIGPEGFTTPDVPFNYTISFENLDDATASAQVVTIIDVIDTDVFDPDTIRLGPILVASNVVATPLPNSRTWSTVVPLPGLTDLLGVDATWDDATSELTWTLTTVDPDTLELTEDPVAGFLPPNVQAPEGEGSVSLSIEPRQRTDGLVLANAASIVFDANAPIVTDVWTNTLDGTPPTSTVAALPATSATSFDVSWSGSDAVSGVDGYEIWVQADGGLPDVWFTADASLLSAEFTGSPGTTYSFWTRAWDGAGNLEEAPRVAQATTTIPGLPGPPQGVSATAFVTTASVSWSPPTGGGLPVTGYTVTAVPGGATAAAGPLATQALIVGLAPQTTYTFTVVATTESGVSLAGTSPPATTGFTDVGAAHPFFTNIAWLADSGYTNGYADGSFRPTASISRQAMAAFLWRMAGQPAVPTDAPTFPDVPVGHPFRDAIRWLASEKITSGYADGTFRPAADITRQAMASFLWRLDGQPPVPAGAPTFPDVPVGHPFRDAIRWMASEKITSGYADGTFRPASNTSRQAMAAFLFRYQDDG